MDTLLIIDDNEGILKQLKWGLKTDYSVATATKRQEAVAFVSKHRPKVVTVDLGLPPDPEGVEEGFRCLSELMSIAPEAKYIVLTGKGEKENALKAISMGAYDFYSKPIDLSVLRIILARAFKLAELESENKRLAEETCLCRQHGSMIGQSPQMQAVFSTINKVAASDVPVLILGESGTGKELAARAIHAQSLRSKGPFIPINCGAIPEKLLESEFFGHEKGAFTDAQARVLGRVEYAKQGTLFLDEIGELPAALQVKLLRFLQEKVFQRVGGREDISSDARIISATNLDIKPAISSGRLREDFYYRISVVSIYLPTVNQRGDDIILLAHYFLGKASEEFGKKIKGFSLQSIEMMKSYSWPGNVRELENKIKRAVIMSSSPIIQPVDLCLETDGVSISEDSQFENITLREARNKVEFRLLANSLEANEGNIAKMAEGLGVSRPTLYDLMKKHGLRVENYSGGNH